jgi:hypothetical protein
LECSSPCSESVNTGPLIWAAHFLLCYCTGAIWCEKVGEDFAVVRIAISAYTVLALVGVLAIAWYGNRRHRLGGTSLPHDDDTPEDRHRFLGFATLLLAALSAVAILYAGLVAVFVRSCE